MNYKPIVYTPLIKHITDKQLERIKLRQAKKEIAEWIKFDPTRPNSFTIIDKIRDILRR